MDASYQRRLCQCRSFAIDHKCQAPLACRRANLILSLRARYKFR